MILQQTQPDGVPTWAQVGWISLLPLVGLVALYRFRTGWGDQGRTLQTKGAWGQFLARFGFVLLPFTYGMLSMALAVLCGRLQFETDADVFGFLALAFGLTTLGSLIWGIKEYRKPSKWRHRPTWLVEFERGNRRR